MSELDFERETARLLREENLLCHRRIRELETALRDLINQVTLLPDVSEARAVLAKDLMPPEGVRGWQRIALLLNEIDEALKEAGPHGWVKQ
jgi:hypothetical protein